MTELTFLLDCDGVLADFTGSMFSLCAREAGRQRLDLGPFPTSDDVKSWDLREYLTPPQHKFMMAILDGHISVDHHPAIYMKPVPYAHEAVDELSRRGEVFVVTAPWADNTEWEYRRRVWIKRHFGIDEDHVISTTVKYLVDGDVLVDDRPKHIEQWEARRGKKAILFSHAHNSSFEHKLRIREWDMRTVDMIENVARENRKGKRPV